MKMTKLLLVCICCVLAVPAVWGQAANTQATPGILGYLDPHTGAFRPVASPAQDASVDMIAAATTVFGGTINVTLTITIKSVGITTVSCTALVSVTDNILTGSPTSITESNTVAATGTGTTRTCKLSIPYSWSLASASSDNMMTSYVVTGAASATNALPNRNHTTSPLDTRKVPANGAITTLTAGVTI